MHKNIYLIVTNDEYELPVAERIGIRACYQEYIKTHDRSEYFKKRWREKHG